MTTQDKILALIEERRKLVKKYTNDIFMLITPALSAVTTWLGETNQLHDNEALEWEQVVPLDDGRSLFVVGYIVPADGRAQDADVVPVRLVLPMELATTKNPLEVLTYLSEQESKAREAITELLQKIFNGDSESPEMQDFDLSDLTEEQKAALAQIPTNKRSLN